MRTVPLRPVFSTGMLNFSTACARTIAATRLKSSQKNLEENAPARQDFI
jgi:hypothetical protein